jgi:putative Mg2+ transporter-C (MgtC) family protein
VEWEPFLRMLWAAGLAVPVGLDRELRGKPAGLRTHVVVATASAALGYVSIAAAEAVGSDQTRIAAQVVSGIGFMGAGIIFAAGGRVHGLTTAAALWAASAIGLCVGLGADTLAIALTAVTMAFLWPVDWLVGRLLRRMGREERVLHLVARSWQAVGAANRLVSEQGVDARDFTFGELGGDISARMTIRCRPGGEARLGRSLLALDGVGFVAIEETSDPVGEWGEQTGA